MSKLKRKFLATIDWMIGTTNLDEYDRIDKERVIQEVDHDMNRVCINKLNKRINQIKRENPQDYDINYVNTLESIVEDLKVSPLAEVRKRAKRMRDLWSYHRSKALAYSYFLGVNEF